MQWEFIVAIALAIPIILFPIALIWYINIGGIYQAIQRSRKRRAAHLRKRSETRSELKELN